MVGATVGKVAGGYSGVVHDIVWVVGGGTGGSSGVVHDLGWVVWCAQLWAGCELVQATVDQLRVKRMPRSISNNAALVAPLEKSKQLNHHEILDVPGLL